MRVLNIDYGKWFPIEEYYEKVVIPLDSRFKKRKKGMFVCCFHDDTDPSLGIIYSKDKGEIYHCFGCNAWGNIIDMHKKVSRKYFRKSIGDERAIKELCEIFNVDPSELPKVTNVEDITDKEVRKQLAIAEAMNHIDVGYFQNKIIEGKMENKGIPYYNTLLIRMIDEYNK